MSETCVVRDVKGGQKSRFGKANRPVGSETGEARGGVWNVTGSDAKVSDNRGTACFSRRSRTEASTRGLKVVLSTKGGLGEERVVQVAAIKEKI